MAQLNNKQQEAVRTLAAQNPLFGAAQIAKALGLPTGDVSKFLFSEKLVSPGKQPRPDSRTRSRQTTSVDGQPKGGTPTQSNWRREWAQAGRTPPNPDQAAKIRLLSQAGWAPDKIAKSVGRTPAEVQAVLGTEGKSYMAAGAKLKPIASATSAPAASSGIKKTAEQAARKIKSQLGVSDATAKTIALSFGAELAREFKRGIKHRAASGLESSLGPLGTVLARRMGLRSDQQRRGSGGFRGGPGEPGSSGDGITGKDATPIIESVDKYTKDVVGAIHRIGTSTARAQLATTRAFVKHGSRMEASLADVLTAVRAMGDQASGRGPGGTAGKGGPGAAGGSAGGLWGSLAAGGLGLIGGALLGARGAGATPSPYNDTGGEAGPGPDPQTPEPKKTDTAQAIPKFTVKVDRELKFKAKELGGVPDYSACRHGSTSVAAAPA